MDEERFYFLRRTAARFAQKEDADMEPIRMQEAVNEGKVIVLRIVPSLSDTGRAFATNPLVRRAAYAKKMAHKRGENTDPFYCVWNEADKTANEHSNLGNILSEYGGYGFRCCLLYQAPSNQLPKQLRDETEAQIDTTISFQTTGKDARFIAEQHTVDKDSLSKLLRHTFYVNTDTKTDDPTGSIMVDAYPPIREMRAEVQEVDPMTDEEIAEMKRRAVERIGAVPETNDEMIEGSHFLGDGPSTQDDGDETDDGGSAALVRAKALQAIYDEGFYGDDPDGFVTLQEASDRIGRYVERVSGDVPDTPSQIEGVLGQLPPSILERDRTDELRVRCTDEGKMRFLSPVDEDDDNDEINENTGGFEHAELMREAYDDLLAVGLPLHVCHQAGDDPDALAEPESTELRLAGSNPTLEPAEVASLVEKFREENPLLDRLSGAGTTVDVEAEHSTGDTAPGE